MTIMVRLVFARKISARNMFVCIVKKGVAIVIKVTVIFISARYVMMIIERRNPKLVTKNKQSSAQKVSKRNTIKVGDVCTLIS